MGTESFKYIYPIIKAALEGPDSFVAEAVKALDVKSERAFIEEAEKLIGLMESYKEPELPFAGISAEQIEKAFADHNARYGFVIWSNQMAGTEEDCADRVKADPDSYLGWSEEEVRQACYESCSEDRDIVKSTMSTMGISHILIYGALGRWDGPKAVCSVRHSILDVFDAFTGDGCTLYIQDGHLKIENAHHDGVDHFTVYGFREGLDVENAQWETKEDVLRDTVSLVPALDKHFGWGLGRDVYPGKGKK